jgi:hypothetical protein
MKMLLEWNNNNNKKGNNNQAFEAKANKFA